MCVENKEYWEAEGRKLHEGGYFKNLLTEERNSSTAGI
jgi:hypothetical protein